MLVHCKLCASYTTQTVRNKHEKLEGKGEASFHTPFMKQSDTESTKKIAGALKDLLANQHSQSGHNLVNQAGLAVKVCWQILKGSHGFLHTLEMALCHKWGVKTGFTFALQYFMLISDGLGGVQHSSIIA